MTASTDRDAVPDERGYFGAFGGRYVPETLMPALAELEQAYAEAREDAAFSEELDGLLRDFVGRPTPITRVDRLARRLAGEAAPAVYLKREDLTHTGAHKINAALAQGLLAKRMGKPRIVAETGAGQHGVATATACALLGLECVVYMGAEDVRRQSLNAFRMKLLGAEVRTVDSGSRTLKDAINEAIRDWVTNVRTTHYLLGSVVGPHPYPLLVREFQRMIGEEARAQLLEAEGRLPSVAVRLRGRRLERDRAVPRLPRRPRAADRRRGGGRGPTGPPRRAARGGGRPACCTARAPTCCRTRTAKCSRRTRSRPASTTPAWGPSTPG